MKKFSAADSNGLHPANTGPLAEFLAAHVMQLNNVSLMKEMSEGYKSFVMVGIFISEPRKTENCGPLRLTHALGKRLERIM